MGEKKINSNGTDYADFDNDGDLDLVMNNQGEKATIYRNNTKNSFVKITLNGRKENPKGIGSKIILYNDKKQQVKDVYVNRGYQSSVTYDVIFGLGNTTNIDSIKVLWNDREMQVISKVKANTTLIFDYKEAKKLVNQKEKLTSLFTEINPSELGITFKHKAVDFNDYAKQLLLPQKQSTIDNTMEVGDVNGDGLDDIFLGNTSGNSAELYMQTPSGKFKKSNQVLFEKDKKYNDNNALFFDADADGDVDLYVATGNYSILDNNPLQQDRLYINNGKGVFTKSNKLPKMLSVTKAIASFDFDMDGDLDLFIGGRVIPAKYPNAPESYVLENKDGRFINVTDKVAKDFKYLGLVNDLIFSDYDLDGDKDLIVVGEWLPVTFFKNDKGIFVKSETNTDDTIGWNQTIKIIDIDNDGDDDYLIGNYGKNNKFHPSKEKPLHIYANNFDDNASWDTALSKVSNGKLYPARGKECSSQQTPFLNEKITTYKDFANSTLTDVYGEEKIKNALHLEATNFHSYLMKNQGNGEFRIIDLPIEAQFGPTLDFELIDSKGSQIIFGVGNVYDAEVETIRYDASRGFILDEKMQVIKDNTFILDKESKAIRKVTINDKECIIVLNADDYLTIFEIK